ncbi:hypothetical protein LguiA_022645 [Lonicera macranthoides]
MGALCTLMLILSFSLLTLSTGEDSVTPQKPVISNQTITSASGSFALGFFSPGNSTNTYLGIWYNTIPKQTVIWVANRDSPLPKNSPAVLAVDHDGNLVILNGEKEPIWSSNVPSILYKNTTVGVLLDAGNLVLRDGGNNILWQSFDYPTDTFLPGMKISLNRKTGKNTSLVSWANTKNPRNGIFSMVIDPESEELQLYLWKNHEPYWRSNVYANSYSRTKGYNRSQGFASYVTYVVEGDEVYLTYSVTGQSTTKLRFTLIPSGKAELLLWVQREWVVLWQFPKAECDYYGCCGAFGSCERNGSHPLCACLKGFEPKFQKSWFRGNWTDGCVRKKELSCGRDDFVKLQRMKLPDHAVSLGNMNVTECRFMCTRNCSCTAYAYANVTGEITVKCLNWFGDLVDLVHNSLTDQDLYLKLHSSEVDAISTGDRDKVTAKTRSLIAVLAVSITTVFIFVCIFGYVLRRKRLRRQGVNSMTSTSGVVQTDTELLSVSLRSILVATNNFSEDTKLGEGGFGPVYKGYLQQNQEVAIKRLSRKSLQGLQEFMNELKLIAKLQHTNLVRLLGCCVEEDEMMLIYEYMPNRSLDKFIFDHSKQSNLDWSRRFRIIDGIAQGLLYLHRYSRLRVIHRDLKASNVLLDQAMTPKISDFGMARVFGVNQTEANTKRVVGTYGYMSPEYALYGQFSEKSDVYSFGVLLLEVVSGKKCMDFHCTGLAPTLLGWVWENWKEGRVSESIDPSIRNTCQLHEAAKCIKVGLLCVQEAPSNRPTMSDVVVMLSNETAVVPQPKEPAFSTCSGSISTAEFGMQSYNDVTISTIEPR